VRKDKKKEQTERGRGEGDLRLGLKGARSAVAT